MLTFRKEERLCSKKLIDNLFSKGKTFYVRPFKVVWIDMPLETPVPVQVLMLVGKRHVKNAVDRNKIKRRIREAYRKNKSLFYDFLSQSGKQCAFVIMLTSAEKISYQETEKKIVLILQRLQSEYEKNSN